MSGGEFDWGGRLRKGIGGAQRFPQNGWKPFEECKGRRELDCDSTFLMYRLWQEEKKESARLSDNMKSLCTGLEEYKIRDSLNVVENHVLRLNIEELKELRSADAKLIKELNLRPKEVEYITTTKVVTKDSIVFVLKDSCFNYSDKWVDFYANIPDSTFTYEVRDSLSSAISRIYKHRFLWWRWGTKGYKQTIVNHNPRSKIVYNEIVKVEH